MNKQLLGPRRPRKPGTLEIAVVPHGTVKPRAVIGTVKAFAGLRMSRSQQSEIMEKLVSEGWIFFPGQQPEAGQAKFETDDEAKALFRAIGQTVAELDASQNAYRTKLKAAVAEGEEMLRKASA